MKTQTINRKVLAEIYPTICDGWKATIAGLIMADIDATKIKVDEALIEKAYKAADEDQKKILRKNFDLGFLNIGERPESIPHVYDILKLKRLDLVPFRSPKNKLQKHVNADVDINHVTKVMNGGTKLDWNNSNQNKYMPVFKKAASGLWVVGDFNYWATAADLGSGLYYKSSDDAMYAGKTFEPTYNDYLPE